MRTFLGVDGGGTKTVALIIDEMGAERGRGLGGPCNVATNDDATLRHSLRAAWQEACRHAGLLATETRFAGVCAGVAGYSDEPRRDAFTAILRAEIPTEGDRARCLVVPDYEVAYWGASHGEPGIVAIAGTGSVVYGRNAEGETYREDGLGYLLGDRGSGFNLGLRVLRYTLEQMKEGRQDTLSETVQNHTGAHTQNEIVHWLYSGFSPTRVASLAPVIGSLADAGDEAARKFVAETARQLRHSVRQVRHKLWLPRDTPVYPLGGVWQIGAFLREEFAAPRFRPENAAPEEETPWHDAPFNVTLPQSDAAFGAALLAKGVEL